MESLALVEQIDSTITIPPQFLLGQDGVKTDNVEYMLYKHQDLTLCSWLLSSISASILHSLSVVKLPLIFEKRFNISFLFRRLLKSFTSIVH
ncbi:hypothetical protein GQ457_16G016420 [Hibiscus cannabinus]